MSEAFAASVSPLTIALGRRHDADRDSWSVSVPVLAGSPVECIFPDARRVGRRGVFSLYETDEWLLGCASEVVEADLGALTREFYRDMFAAVGDRHLCRVWNFVPAINDTPPGALENYRVFTRARAEAFEAAYGHGFKHRLPAASAVGCDDRRLAVMFAAHRSAPRHYENPCQVPAYEYPFEHGPRPPSFSRATVLTRGDRVDAFISGTAAISGHATVAPGDTAGQTEPTLENLRRISRACGLGDDLGAGRARARFVRVYLRHAADLVPVAAALEGVLIRPGDHACFLRADICRAALNLEIEVSVIAAERE